MRYLSFTLRDAFWLLLVVGLLMSQWLWHQRVKTLEAEVASLRSEGRLKEYIETPVNQVIRELEQDYGVWIEVDWDSFKERGLNLYRFDMLITKRFKPGSLHNAIYHIFDRQAVLTPGPGKVTISARPDGEPLPEAR